MKNTQYKIAVITNVNGQAMTDLENMSKANGVVYDQIKVPCIPLSGFKTSDLVKKLLTYDIVYYRTGIRGPILNELSYILNKAGIPFVNNIGKYSYAHHKIGQAIIADHHNITQPKSFYVTNFNYDRVTSVLGEKFVIKPDEGSKGNEVALISSEEELHNFKINKKKNKYIYQEYIENAEEYRVYTLGNKGVATYKKIPGSDDFRANLHLGGSMTKTEPEYEEMLMKFGGHVAECFEADIAGIDILIKNGECLFLEINFQPGWENLDEMSGTNYCKESLQYILNKAHKSKKWWQKILR